MISRRRVARFLFLLALGIILIWPLSEKEKGSSIIWGHTAPSEKQDQGELARYVGAATFTKTQGDEDIPKDYRVIQRVVRQGDTIEGIASFYGTDEETIRQINTLGPASSLRPGQVLLVVNFKGMLHTVAQGETLYDLANFYGVSVDTLREVNHLTQKGVLRVGQKLLVPGGAHKQRNGAMFFRNIGSMQYFWPVAGRISSRFGLRWGKIHEGIDIAAPKGTPIYAARAGKVVFAGWEKGYGKTVIIQHGNGLETLYGHSTELLVKAGEQVQKGQKIAKVGSTGNSTGPHLHFEVRVKERPIDPLTLFPSK